MFRIEFSDAGRLARALSNGLVFAGTDRTLPILDAVQLRYAGGVLEVRATDRYRASIEEVPFKSAEGDAGGFAFTLARASAAQLVKAIKAAAPARKAYPTPVTVEVSDAADSMTVTVSEATYRYAVMPDSIGQYPLLGHLFPERDQLQPLSTILLNPGFVASLGRVATDDKHAPVRLSFKPGRYAMVLAEFTNGPRVLIMSVRDTAAEEQAAA